MRSISRHRYTWKEYLAFERTSNVKHEFYAGEIFAIAGGKRNGLLQHAVEQPVLFDPLNLDY